MLRSQPRHQFRGPRACVRRGMRQHVHAAGLGNLEPGHVGRMRERRLAMRVRGGHGRAGDVHPHRQYPLRAAHDCTGEDLHAVGASIQLGFGALARLCGRGDFRADRAGLCPQLAHVDRRSVFGVERHVHGQQARSLDLAFCHARAQRTDIARQRTDVEQGGKAPLSEAVAQCVLQRLRRLRVGLVERRGHQVHMAVPEPGGHAAALAVDDAGPFRHLHLAARADRSNASVTDHHRPIGNRGGVR